MQKLLVVALASVLALTACSRKNLTTPTIPKNPTSVPTTTGGNTIDPTVTRTVVSKLVLTPSFEGELQDKGIYTPDVCLQLAKLTQGTKVIGTYLEMSSVPCPGSGLVAESDVLLRLTVRQSPQYATQFRLVYEQSASPEVGALRKITNNGVTEYRMEGLCDIDVGGYGEGWDTYCSIAVESSLFRNPDPLDLYNLD